MNSQDDETIQGRRERRLRKKRERMPKHGKTLSKVYLDAIRKRLEHEQKGKP